MKLLIISYNFPPYNASGSVRVGKLARYLIERGHDVRVVAGEGLPFPKTLDMHFPDATVVHVPYWNVEAPIDWARRRLQGGDIAVAAVSTGSEKQGLARKLVGFYRALFAIPDGQLGWRRPALRAARTLVKNWRPDMIVSSALPFTCHVVARKLARELDVPWIAEFRDLFAENPYNDVARWRAWLNGVIERHTMKDASGCTTVSQPLADALVAAHGRPTAVILNGFDAADVVPGIVPPRGPRPLRILYTGIIYPGRRDPRPLFAAIAKLGEHGKQIVVDFYGQDMRGVAAMAAEAGVSAQVRIFSPVSYQKALRLQQEADILLLLLWDDPREKGVFTGKIFEYAGAGRPILSIGAEAGVAAELIRERKLGVSASGVDSIAAALTAWLDEFENSGCVAGPSPGGRAGLSRADQFAKFENFIAQFARAS
ncbi:glycosyltransferase [soil metagenome]